MQKITHHIDWLQYSTDWPQFVWDWPIDDREARDIVRGAIPHIHLTGAPIERANSDKPYGMQGYTRTYDMGYASAHVDPNRREMKIGVRMTGQDLSAWRDFGGTDKMLVGFVKGAKGATSRVDIAFDLFNYGIGIMALYKAWKSGKIKCKARKVNPVTSAEMSENGEVVEASSLYFGSRTSELMVRFYDKGKEQHTDLDWTRVEIEVKGDKAKTVMEDMHRLGVDVVGKQLLRDYFSVMPYKFWKALVNGESVALTSVGRKMTEREAWIRNIVFPVLREEIEREWAGCIESGITREVEALVREHWMTRAQVLKKTYGLI